MKDTEILQLYEQLGIYFIEELDMPTQTKPIINTVNTRDIVDRCNSLPELFEAIKNFNGCSELKNGALNTVISDGNPNAKIVFIGEAPGEQEDKKGIPFCGRSGDLLDKMLVAINLDRTKVYITNTLFWRPPNNRTPTFNEMQSCLPFLEKHIALIDPLLIVLVGSSACKALMNLSISELRGVFSTYSNRYMQHKKISITGIFHPAYLLRQQSKKVVTWEDLKAIRKFLDSDTIDL